MIFVINMARSQSSHWSKLFDTHSTMDLGSSMPTNVIVDDENILIPVVEKDHLNFYKLNGNGEVIQSLNTNYASGQFTTMISLEESYAIIFDNAPQGPAPVYRLLYLNKNLEVIDEHHLDLPGNTALSRVLTLFKINNQLYFTASDYSNETYSLLSVSNNNELTLKFSGAFSVSQDKVDVLPNGNIVVDYEYEKFHTLKCINPLSGLLVWEKNYGIGNEMDLGYRKSINELGQIFLARHVRKWDENSQQKDGIYLQKINSDSGDIMMSKTLNIEKDGAVRLEELQFDNTTQSLYITYLSYAIVSEIVFSKLDASCNVLNQVVIPAPDNKNSSSPIFRKSKLKLKGDGSVILVYRSFKNPLEMENLNLNLYSPHFELENTAELNIPNKNGDEICTDIEVMNDKIVISGFVPNTNPSMFWEKMQHFVAMVDLTENLTLNGVQNSNGVSIEPNPVKNTLTLKSEYVFNELTIYNQSGQCMVNLKNPGKTIDVSQLSSGAYLIKIIGIKNNTTTLKFIKS